MNASDPPSVSKLSMELAAAFEWWREAGVDSDFHNDATAWLSSDEKEGAPSPLNASPKSDTKTVISSLQKKTFSQETVTARVDFFAKSMPQSLEDFAQFWMTAPGLDVIGPRGRIAPRGPEGAELMALVVDPEPSDSQTLLSGPQGRMLASFLTAAGLDVAHVYFASALPRHTPMADTKALAAGGMDAVLHHHITLAKPKRLIAFGAGLAPLLAPSVSNPDTALRETNQSAAFPPVLASEDLNSLMTMPRLKARFWRRWIEWSAHHG